MGILCIFELLILLEGEARAEKIFLQRVLDGRAYELLIPFSRKFEVSVSDIIPINVTESESDGKSFAEFIIIPKRPRKVSFHVDMLLPKSRNNESFIRGHTCIHRKERSINSLDDFTEKTEMAAEIFNALVIEHRLITRFITGGTDS